VAVESFTDYNFETRVCTAPDWCSGAFTRPPPPAVHILHHHLKNFRTHWLVHTCTLPLTQRYCILPTEIIYGSPVVFKINSEYLPKQH
jgi:hypothetical protein